ncbi:LolA-like protein [Catenuloplanes japonicus]|uniref:hypothetical protein n=1 Tax=Catenuloplanes japonicus TaxID=33876 RepID=UPI0012FA26E0|nr:hypothetical protein [Catenuloplanes japonicus]
MSRGRIATLAALVLALTGCAGPSDAPAPGSAASTGAGLPDPKTALAASVAALDALNYEFKLSSPYDGVISVVVHGPSGSLEVQQRAKYSATDITDVRYRTVGDVQWLRLDFSQTEGLPPDLPGVLTGQKWLPAKGLANDGAFGPLRLMRPEKNLTGAEGLVTSVVTVTRKGTASFDGTVDVTDVVPGALGFSLEKEHVAALGDRAASLSFRATTDGQGRLRQFGFDYPAAGEYPAGSVSFTFDQYDAARPAGRRRVVSSGRMPTRRRQRLRCAPSSSSSVPVSRRWTVRRRRDMCALGAAGRTCVTVRPRRSSVISLRIRILPGLTAFARCSARSGERSCWPTSAGPRPSPCGRSPVRSASRRPASRAALPASPHARVRRGQTLAVFSADRANRYPR